MTDEESVDTDFESIFEGILGVNLDEYEVTVCLASVYGESSLPEFQKLQLEEPLAEEYRNVVRGIVGQLKKNKSNHDLVLRSHEPGSNPEPQEVEHLDLSEHKLIKDQIAPLDSPMDLGIYDDDDTFKSGLRFYIIILQREGNEPIYCFRSYSPKKELKRSTSFAAIFSEGHFNSVEEPVLLFDQRLDCISRGDSMFILTRWNFQQIFRFYELYRRWDRKY